jgi:hypothetical protein
VRRAGERTLVQISLPVLDDCRMVEGECVVRLRASLADVDVLALHQNPAAQQSICCLDFAASES